eukprot:IDg7837t1
MGHSHDKVAFRFGLSTSSVTCIVKSSSTLEKISSVSVKRRNLNLGGKLKVIHLLHCSNNTEQAVANFKISPRNVCRKLKIKSLFAEHEITGIPIGVSRPLKARYSAVERNIL